MLDPQALAKIRDRHQKERTELADGHDQQRADLARMQETRAKRAREDRDTGKHAVRPTSNDDDVKRRVGEHAKLKAKQDDEFQKQKDRHKKEMDDAKAGKGSGAAGPGRSTGPTGHGAIDKVWRELSGTEQQEAHKIIEKYAGQHRKFDEAKVDEQKRHDRYKSSAMTAKVEEARLSGHSEINAKQEAEIASFMRKIEHRTAIKSHKAA